MLSSIFPIFCVGCQRFDKYLCRDCAQSVRNHGVQNKDGLVFQSAFRYEGLLADVLGRIKNKQHFGYIKVMADYLGEFLQLDTQTQVLVPPTTKAAFRKRGFSPSWELAKSAGLNVSNNLRRMRQTRDQQVLSYVTRQSNLQGALSLRRPGKYLLFDDVIASGATVREMIRAVEFGGGEVSGIVALCSTSPKGANYE